ncbi:MAG: ECF-type sigma factor [Pirellulales bacterium]
MSSNANSPGRVTDWVQQLQLGRQDVMTDLFDFYFDRLIALGRTLLPAGGRRVADEEDLALQVLGAFLQDANDGKLPDLGSRRDVWRMLSKRLEQRANNQGRDAMRLKRGGGQVRGESAFIRMIDEGMGGIDQMAVDSDRPEQPVLDDERLEQLARLHERLLTSLDDPLLQSVAQLLLKGVHPDEIGRRLNISRAGVFRKLNLIKTRWRQLEYIFES